MKASHIKASQPHFPHFRVLIFSTFSTFLLHGVSSNASFSGGERDLPHFRRIGFESLISKVRPTGSILRRDRNYRSLEALRAEKVSKKSSRASWPRVSKKSRKGRKSLWGVGSANLGRPIFASKFPQTPLKQAFSRKNRGRKWGAPNLQIQRPTDPTPHLKPSERVFSALSRVETTGRTAQEDCFETFLNSVQTRCVVKGEAQKSPLFWRFSGGS